MTSHRHAAVWVDRHEARIFHVDRESFDEHQVRAPGHHVHRHPKGAAESREHPVVHTCELPVYTYPGMAMSGVDLLTTLEQVAKEQLEKELARVCGSFAAATAILRTGITWEQILNTIDAVHADLVVMGTHGRRGVTHLLLGSIAEKIVRTSRAPVLTVRGQS